MKEKIKVLFKKIVQFFLNPKLLLCFGIGWMITNGWSYILFGLGTWLGNEWMIGISSAYLTLLWLPVSPEKLITLTIAIWLMKILFPNDKKTLGTLHQSLESFKKTLRRKKQEHQDKKQQEQEKRNIQKGDG
jgi:hypothetical protein